ncbi:MAG: NAD(+)/NADH kinase [Erysipelotrichaceae bacterium]|nr:NAD(+)/NADH kinase [Erysipelotrichaceae bacterium]
MKKALIIPNPYLKDKERIIKDVTGSLGFMDTAVFDEGLDDDKAYEKLGMMAEDCDCLIPLGGDGSILKIAETAARKGLPVLGIKYGGVGYLSSIDKDELILLEHLKDDTYGIEERLMLEADIMAEESCSRLALNDVMIVKKEINVPIKLMVNDSELYYGDGIVIASPTGSSAYSFSAGGPLLIETGRELVLTPICPVARNVSYTVYDDSMTFDVRSIRDTRDEALVSIDGFKPLLINNKSTVHVSASEYVTRLIRI